MLGRKDMVEEGTLVIVSVCRRWIETEKILGELQHVVCVA